MSVTSIHPAIRSGRVAAITGGASGIGLALARRYQQSGMSVAVGDIDEDALKSVPDEIYACKVDVTDNKSLESFRESIQQ